MCLSTGWVHGPGGWCMVLGGGAWSWGVYGPRGCMVPGRSGGDPPPPPTATAAGGMHPTGMHSCSLHFSPIRTCEVRSFISWDGTLHSFCVHSPTFTTVQLVIIMFMIKVFDHCVKDTSLSSLSEPNSSPSSPSSSSSSFNSRSYSK